MGRHPHQALTARSVRLNAKIDVSASYPSVFVAMADRKKLQGEIERCLKKVSEGVELFEEIWQKVITATNPTLKEKYETDLKKEIKKLQRLRDQIKTWLASSEIKDKSTLLDNRKLIETQMERFKAVEREMKIKAYSKEGLDGAPKVDPAQKEKEDMTVWLSNSIEALGIHVDQFESEMESLAHGLKKKSDNKDRMDELKALLARHQYHILKLETLMRMLDNGTIEACKISEIKEDVEYYIESCQDPDFEENEFLYDDLNLQDMTDILTTAAMGLSLERTNAGIPDQAAANVDVPAGSDPTRVEPGGPNLARPVTGGQDVDAASSAVKRATTATAVVNSKPLAPITGQNKSTSSQGSSDSSSMANLKRNHPAVSPPMPYAVAAAASVMITPSSSPPMAPSTDGDTKYGGHFHRATLAAPKQHSGIPITSTANIVGQKPGNKGAAINSERPAPSPAGDFLCLSSENSKDWPSLPTAPSLQRLSVPPVGKGGDSTRSSTSMAQRAVRSAALESHQFPPLPRVQALQKSSLQQSLHRMVWHPEHQLKQGEPSRERGMFQFLATPWKEVPRPQTSAAKETPLGSTASGGTAPLSDECRHQLRLLEAASRHMPLPGDSERLRSDLPRRPVVVPSYYPQRLPQRDMGAFFQKLSEESLFFAFYNMEGSTAQHLAARALKKQSWRFHTKHKAWFRRQDDPKIITDEYERGNYIYFDFETWREGSKENFTFEYQYLEERDLN
ncbi:hypothetical protein HPB48_014490 [Haemaphysalis longicornis]|uniref:CCR4-NOT transcription complex subunit 3 n=1 Tax=Haemaphysalis longicornis TaxID=44386 RepID=A0A9J6GPL0_HAELO|nr:hypothetical protein HPB48_014490 [Haemaphysalis longicornis]